jgi:hypothetical protein
MESDVFGGVHLLLQQLLLLETVSLSYTITWTLLIIVRPLVRYIQLLVGETSYSRSPRAKAICMSSYPALRDTHLKHADEIETSLHRICSFSGL